MTLPLERSFRAGLVQLRSGRSVAPNMEMAEALIRRAAKGGADYVQTPENTAIMEMETERLFAELDVEEKACRSAAPGARQGAWHLAACRLARHETRPGKVANRSYLVAPDGEIVARYDKLHIFDVDLAGDESYRESRIFGQGPKPWSPICPGARLGLSICYDLRFAALYRALATEGADFIAVPSAFTKQTGEAHWQVLLRARAIETGAFILAADKAGCTRMAAAPMATA